MTSMENSRCRRPQEQANVTFIQGRCLIEGYIRSLLVTQLCKVQQISSSECRDNQQECRQWRSYNQPPDAVCIPGLTGRLFHQACDSLILLHVVERKRLLKGPSDLSQPLIQDFESFTSTCCLGQNIRIIYEFTLNRQKTFLVRFFYSVPLNSCKFQCKLFIFMNYVKSVSQ